MATEYEKTIYATPDEWGSQTVYGDKPTMQSTIASLIDAGGEEWKTIELGDCVEWELVQVVNGLGLYKAQHVRNDNYIALWNGRALPIKMAVRLVNTMQETDSYQQVYFPRALFGGRHIAEYNTLEEAIEELEGNQ